jgi:hypothetical protein
MGVAFVHSLLAWELFVDEVDDLTAILTVKDLEKFSTFWWKVHQTFNHRRSPFSSETISILTSLTHEPQHRNAKDKQATHVLLVLMITQVSNIARTTREIQLPVLNKHPQSISHSSNSLGNSDHLHNRLLVPWQSSPSPHSNAFLLLPSLTSSIPFACNTLARITIGQMNDEKSWSETWSALHLASVFFSGLTQRIWFWSER